MAQQNKPRGTLDNQFIPNSLRHDYASNNYKFPPDIQYFLTETLEKRFRVIIWFYITLTTWTTTLVSCWLYFGGQGNYGWLFFGSLILTGLLSTTPANKKG